MSLRCSQLACPHNFPHNFPQMLQLTLRVISLRGLRQNFPQHCRRRLMILRSPQLIHHQRSPQHTPPTRPHFCQPISQQMTRQTTPPLHPHLCQHTHQHPTDRGPDAPCLQGPLEVGRHSGCRQFGLNHGSAVVPVHELHRSDHRRLSHLKRWHEPWWCAVCHARVQVFRAGRRQDEGSGC